MSSFLSLLKLYAAARGFEIEVDFDPSLWLFV